MFWKPAKSAARPMSTIQLCSESQQRALQSLICKMNYCTQIVYGGRFFLRRLINVSTLLRQSWHRTRVTADMRADIRWWLLFGLLFCSKPLPMVSEQRPGGIASISIDACGRAAGAFFMADSAYTEFSEIHPDAPSLCINHKEILALLSTLIFGPSLWPRATPHT